MSSGVGISTQAKKDARDEQHRQETERKVESEVKQETQRGNRNAEQGRRWRTDEEVNTRMD